MPGLRGFQPGRITSTVLKVGHARGRSSEDRSPVSARASGNELFHLAEALKLHLSASLTRSMIDDRYRTHIYK